MDKHYHRIFLAGLDFDRWHYPALNVRSFVRPLDAFRFAPVRVQASVVVRELAPFAKRSSENFGWRVVPAKFRRRDLTVARQREVGKISKRVNAFGAFPNCPCGIVCQVQLGNRASAAFVIDQQNAIGCLPEE